MTDLSPTELFACIDKVEVGQTTPVMVLPIGTWQTKKYGALPFDEEFADKLIAHFEARALEQTEPFIDSGRHDEQTPASAWLKRLYKAPFTNPDTGESGLAVWADAEWTEDGAQTVNARKFKYLSPAIAQHIVTGSGEKVAPVLRSMTPTNIPVLRAMPAILDAPDWLEASEGADEVELLLDEVTLAEWTTAYINDLPDSAFAYVEPGEKEDGKTVPRSKRHFPIRDADGKLDPAHVRNALARLPQSSLSSAAKGKVRAKVQAAAKELGIGEYNDPLVEVVRMTEVAKVLSLAEDADEATVVAACESLLTERAALAQEKAVLDEEVFKLREEKAAVEKAARDARRDTLLEELIKTGCIYPEEKDVLAELAEDNFELFERMAESRKGRKVIDLTDHGVHTAPDEPKHYDDPSTEVSTRARAKVAGGASYSDAVKLVLAEDEDLAKAYIDWVTPRMAE